jgi:hypothetical protein
MSDHIPDWAGSRSYTPPLTVLRRELDEARTAAEVEARIVTELRSELRDLRALLREVRDSYRRPWDYGFTAIVATDQRLYAAWLEKLDAALKEQP